MKKSGMCSSWISGSDVLIPVLWVSTISVHLIPRYELNVWDTEGLGQQLNFSVVRIVTLWTSK